MTGQEIINLIQEYGLEDFEMNVSFSEFVGMPNEPYAQRTFEVVGFLDIGNSDKTFKMEIEEK